MAHGAERRRRKQRAIAMLLALATAGLVAWALGLVWFVDRIPRTLVGAERHTDAIVVLTGGSLRLETGFQLLAERKAEKLFVSGVQKGVPIDDLLALHGLTAADMACCITLGYMAADTGGNAQESATWVRANGLGSVRLVTSNYHMPRSLMEFHATMPKLEIVPHPVFSQRVMIDKWWRRPGTASLVIAEYNKYLLAATRLALSGARGK